MAINERKRKVEYRPGRIRNKATTYPLPFWALASVCVVCGLAVFLIKSSQRVRHAVFKFTDRLRGRVCVL